MSSIILAVSWNFLNSILSSPLASILLVSCFCAKGEAGGTKCLGCLNTDVFYLVTLTCSILAAAAGLILFLPVICCKNEIAVCILTYALLIY